MAQSQYGTASDVSVDTEGDTRARDVGQVYVKTFEDTDDCYISGMVVVSGDRLVITDAYNNAVKLVDVRLNNVITRLPLSSQPIDVTKIKQNQVAVSLGNERKIEIFTVSDVLSRSHTIHVLGDSFTSLCYDGEGFIILCESTSERTCAVDKVGVSGEERRTVYTDSEQRLQFPRYLTSSRDNSRLYITDLENHSVITMTSGGEVTSVYKHSQLRYPLGVAVGPGGNVYVCCRDTITVHNLSASGEHGKVVLDRKRGLEQWPQVVSLGDSSGILYAGGHSNDVKLFKLE